MNILLGPRYRAGFVQFRDSNERETGNDFE